MKNSKSIIYLLVGLIVLTIVVIAAALFFFPKEAPKTTKAPTEATNPTATPVPDEFDPVEWTRNPQTTPLQTPAPATGDQGFTVTLPPETPNGTTTPGAGTGTAGTGAPNGTAGTAGTATQGLPPSPGATFPGETSASGSKPANVSSKPVAAVPATPAKAPKAAKPVVKTKVTEFWIQVASFKDRYQAENTSKALETQGLKGTLTTATVNGQTVVRVRVGPYANEAEAGKFLAWLKPVKEFAGSYITKVSATHTN